MVRALESAAIERLSDDGATVAREVTGSGLDVAVRPGPGVAIELIGPETRLRVVDAILSGMHEPGESPYELLRAFIGDRLLDRAHRTADLGHYRTHEFGDSILIERKAAA